MQAYRTLDIRDYLVFNLLGLEDSTTLFLESAKGQDMKVVIDAQIEDDSAQPYQIRRLVRLYFHSPEQPALFSVSFLNKRELTDMEYHCLTYRNMPIGRIFTNLNDPASIRKKNISIYLGTDMENAARLNVKNRLLYRKEYDYWVGKRKIARICEFFNEESLKR